MFKVEDDGRKAHNSFKASVEVGSFLVFGRGPSRSQAIAELRIELRNLRDELDHRMAELRGAE